MIKRRYALMAAAVLLCGLAASAAFLASPMFGDNALYESAAVSLQMPSGGTPTTQQVIDAMSGYYKGALPSGWSVIDEKGHIVVRYTGILEPGTGKKQIIVAVVDDTSDLEHAWLYLGGSQVFHASLNNGGIVTTTGGDSIASLTTFLPLSTPYELQVVWSSATSGPESETIIPISQP